MTAVYQAIGLAALALGLFGTWLAARRRLGWLLCIASSGMWLPALVTGGQWAAVVNCALSMAVCARNIVVRPSVRLEGEYRRRAAASGDEVTGLVRT